MFLAGEIFPDSEQINDLRKKGHVFPQCDAGYLVHLYEEMEGKFFEELNGNFSALLIDRRQNKSFLFNDRFGMHRVFIHHGKDGFFFSSEAKALLAVLPETRDFDPKALTELLTCDCTLGEQSLFKEIKVLPGGSLLEFSNGNLLRNTHYFDRKIWEEQVPLSEAEFTSRFIEILPKITKNYASSREPAGISLTGGFDSRMVMASLDPSPGSFPCYTFGSMYRDTFDVKVARKVAKECGQTHQVLVLGEEFLSELPKYLEKAVFLSDGYIGLSGAAELYANSLAREVSPVRLTGNWGSELLRGVRAFKFIESSGKIIHPDLHRFVEEAKTTFSQMNEINSKSFVPFHQAPYQSYGRGSIERSQLTPRTPFLDNDIVKLVYQSPKTFDGFALAEAIITRLKPDLLTIPTDRGYLGTEGAIIRAGRRIYREALFKAEYWIGYGAPDWLVREQKLPLLFQMERQILGRHKFYHFRKWLKESFSEKIQDLFMHDLDSEIKPYINESYFKVMLNEHLNGEKNNAKEIDSILTVVLTARVLL
jgi:asparagine synthase (glutamine-hydrolysing)